MSARRAFTLLEAVLALAILAGVSVVCVGLRAQALASGAKLEARLDDERETQAIFEMATSGLLPRPEIDADSSVRRWRGEHLGLPFAIEATRVVLPNPARGSAESPTAGLSDRIVMWRYLLNFKGRETEFWWHR